MSQASLFVETPVETFQRVFRELRPRTKAPEFSLEYRPYADVNSTIRLEEGHKRVRVRISDLLEGAPSPVLEALAYILLSKLYRKPLPAAYDRRYRSYLNRAELRRKALLIREIRGRKEIRSPKGRAYDLEEIFGQLNQRFFQGLLGQPRLGWSRRPSRRMLGHFDPAHNAIIISKVFDHERVPLFVIEYLVYHEMLHLRYPVEYRSHRRSVHTKEFKQKERKFPRYHEAVEWLKQL